MPYSVKSSAVARLHDRESRTSSYQELVARPCPLAADIGGVGRPDQEILLGEAADYISAEWLVKRALLEQAALPVAGRLRN